MNPTTNRSWRRRTLGFIVTFLLFVLTAALALTAVAAAAGYQLNDAVIVPSSQSEGAGFSKLTQRVSFGDYYDIENPVFRTDENGQVTQVTVFYERPAPDGGSGLEYTVAISAGACDGCNTRTVIEQRLLAAEWGNTQYHWAGHPNFCSPFEDAVYWPCVEEHILAGGLTAAEVYGYSTYDRNAGNAGSTFTTVAGDYTVSVDATVLKYGDYTAAPLEEFRTTTRRLVDLYAAHLLGLPPAAGGGASESGAVVTQTGTGSPPGTASSDYVAPVTVIGALAAVTAVAVTAVTATGGAVVAVTTSSAIPGPASSPVPPGMVPTPTLVDPDTGQLLPTDGGKVWMGDWMSPEEAQNIIDQRIDEIKLDNQAAAQHQDFVSNQQLIREDELANLGFTHDPATNAWIPGASTLAVIDQGWQNKVDQDPAWKAFQDDVQQTQQLIDSQQDWLKTRYEADNQALQTQYDDAMATDTNLGYLVTATSGVKWTAGAAINLVGEIPGPTQKLKWAYNAVVKGVETHYDINPQTGQPNGLFDVAANVGFQLVEDVGLDKVGSMIKLNKVSNLPDDVYKHEFVNIISSGGAFPDIKNLAVGDVPWKQLMASTGRQEVSSLALQRLKSENVKILYETVFKNPISSQFGPSGTPGKP